MATIMEALGGHNGETIMEALGGHKGETIADALNVLNKIYFSTDISDSVDLLGKVASDLQENVTIFNKKFSGTLHYVEGYTGFSSKVDEQEGNYVAFKVVPPEGMTIGTDLSVYLNGTPFDSDGIGIVILKTGKKIVITAEKDGYESRVWTLDVTGLVKEPKSEDTQAVEPVVTQEQESDPEPEETPGE